MPLPTDKQHDPETQSSGQGVPPRSGFRTAGGQSDQPARNFKVIKGTVGPFPPGHVFTTKEFARLHPLPADPKAAQIDPDTYHDDLIGRLKVMGVVAEAESHEKPSDTPVGPEGRPPEAVRNPGIAAAVKEELAQQKTTAAVAAEQLRQVGEVKPGAAQAAPAKK